MKIYLDEHKTKTCIKCDEPKIVPDNYYWSATKKKFINTCKSCYKIKNKEYQVNNLDKFQKSNSRWRKNNPEKVALATRRWRKRNAEQVRKKDREAYWANPEASRAKNRTKYQHNRKHALARAAISNAIRAGRLERGRCEVCGEQKTHGHHPDYNKPLEVVWLCNSHHMELHRKYQ